MKTPPPPPSTTPPQPVRSPTVAAGRPLMNTLEDPSATEPSPLAASPLRAADTPPIDTFPLPSVITPGPVFGGFWADALGMKPVTKSGTTVAISTARIPNPQLLPTPARAKPPPNPKSGRRDLGQLKPAILDSLWRDCRLILGRGVPIACKID